MSELRAEVEGFLRGARRPALLEPGEPLLELAPGHMFVDEWGGKLRVQVWSENRSLQRRVTRVVSRSPGRLELEIERFGGVGGRWLLVDQDARAGHGIQQRGVRLAFAGQFREFLARQFGGWQIAELTSAPDLERSLSPRFARALLTRGGTGWAAIACSPEDDAAALLAFGLIWFDYLRRRERRRMIEGLALFVPSGRETTLCLRAQWLEPRALRLAVFVYDDSGERPVDVAVQGNLETRLATCRPGDEGLRPPSGPEGWLEQRVRAQLEALDASLVPGMVYGQVPAIAGVERGILDLLAIERSGRLVVIELKAKADPELPMQALDYWMRVAWHAARNEFGPHGYFPGRCVLPTPPRLLLVAPALEFHSSTGMILRYLSRQIEVQRIGLAVEWQQELHVAFRMRGRSPVTHYGETYPGPDSPGR